MFVFPRCEQRPCSKNMLTSLYNLSYVFHNPCDNFEVISARLERDQRKQEAVVNQCDAVPSC
jgi:hypothetical protein